MRTSPRGIEDLILSEALKTTAYRDSAGVWTIGVGHTASAGPPAPKAGMKITVAEAKAILARDLAKFEARVNREFPSGLPQHAFDGAVSFDFNTGQIHDASWVDHYRAGRMQQAEANLKLWNKATVDGKKVVLKGLVNRRQHEADLIFRGKYRSGPASAPVPPPVTPDPVPPVEPAPSLWAWLVKVWKIVIG
jgi:lysozyme